MSQSYFDQASAAWDDQPQRVRLMKMIGEAIVREARLTKAMNVLDYGCGTGLVSLFLLPYVHSVTGADSSPGMLEVLTRKIADGHLAVAPHHDRPIHHGNLEQHRQKSLDGVEPCAQIPGEFPSLGQLEILGDEIPDLAQVVLVGGHQHQRRLPVSYVTATVLSPRVRPQ